MSGVYIKGMEMPKSCDVCRFAIDGFCYASGRVNIEAVEGRQVTNYCPLAPVPDHGRLIDADALLNSVTSKYGWFEVDNADVRDAPTIIPADGEEQT